MTIIHMIDVQSTNLKKIGYDEGKELLYVTFCGGSTYRYKCVPKDVYNALIAIHEQQESVGQAFMAQVNGQFEYERVWG